MKMILWGLAGILTGSVLVGTLELIERATESTVATLSGILGLVTGGVVIGSITLLIARSAAGRAARNAAQTANSVQHFAANTPYPAYQQPPVVVVPQSYQPPPPALFERGLNEVGGSWSPQPSAERYLTGASSPATGFQANEATSALPINWDIL